MTSTVPGNETERHQIRARAVRRVFAVALFGFVGAGLFGVFGTTTDEVSARSEGVELTVTYGKIARPGLATPWEVEVRSSGGFDGPVVLATTGSYFDAFDENGLDPSPVKSVGEGGEIVWEFDPPEGEIFSLSFDARIEPAVQMQTFSARTRVLDGNGRQIVAVSYTTRVMP